jgi:hypothetical protein
VRGRGARLQRLLQVHYRRKRLVVDLDRGRGVCRLVELFGQDDGQRLPLVDRLAGADRKLIRDLLLVGYTGAPHWQRALENLPEVLGEVHGVHARHGCGRPSGDGVDGRVRVGAAHEGHVQRTGEADVVHVPPVPRDQARVLAPLNACSY